MILFAAAALAAEPLRVGIFVGNNLGAADEARLVFATSDAAKMRDVFIELGGVDPQRAILLENVGRQGVEAAFAQLHSTLVDARNAGRTTSLVFTYSGHGDVDGLHLGPSVLTHDALRSLLEDSGADVRVAMLDACRSGAALRAKGVVKGPSFDLTVSAEAAHGTAFLTSSAASELSQESADVGGGFFTHYLHTALLGAADHDRDGDITLPEAYTWVHGETAFATRNAPERQTASFDFDLSGAGEVVLTRVDAATSHLNFLGDLSGTFAVWDGTRNRYVAEVDGSRPVTLSLRPGPYAVHRRQPGYLEEAHYAVRRGETHSVVDTDFVSVAYDDAVSRGPLDAAVRKSRMPDLALRVAIGGRRFAAESAADVAYVPGHPVLGLDLRILPPARRWVGFDVLAGGAPTSIVVDGHSVDLTVSSWSVGANAGWATGPNLVRAGLGGQFSALALGRHFPDPALGTQTAATLGGGPKGWVGVHHGRFTADLDLTVLLTPLTWDDAVTFPILSQLTLAAGVRF